MTDFERKTVDEFLRRAMIPAYQFEGKEWADEQKKRKRPSRQRGAVRNRLPDHFEPPLVRLCCTGCKTSWDAWVDDDGTLQDPRDAKCGTAGCKRPNVIVVVDP